jgi:peptidoglycan/LPS O-acetylase OafA/YrhL
MDTSEHQAHPLLRPFYPALDGLRAFAFLSVFLSHYGPLMWPGSSWDWGWTGVDIFFVLSGFLITGILYDSIHRKRYFKDFYIRRSLRIFPLYYCLWLVVILLSPLLHVQWNRYVIAMAGYFGNFFVVSSTPGLQHSDPGMIAYSSLRHHAQTNYLNIRAFWSLCVEEQFYAVWPAVIYFVRSRRTLLRICLLIVAALPFLRALSLHWVPEVTGHRMLYFNTFARADTLLAGAAIALLLRGPTMPVDLLRRSAMPAAIGAPLVLAMCLWSATHYGLVLHQDTIVETIGYTLIALAASGMLVLALDSSTRLNLLLGLKPLRYLGRISYGMYIFHALLGPIFSASEPSFVRHHVTFLFLPVAFLCIAAIASLSFRYLESPFLRLKQVFAPRASRGDTSNNST